MASPIIQFRISKEEMKFMKQRGLKPNETARKSLAGYLRAVRFRESTEWLESHPLPSGVDLVKAVREARDEWDAGA